MRADEEDIGWLDCLISEYSRLYYRHEADEDEDPDATAEMVMRCRGLAARLRNQLRPEPLEAVEQTRDDEEIPF